MFETKEGIIKPIVYVGIINQDRLLLVDYKQAPNPLKSGWWIPAPGLEFGEDPQEKALKICADFGIRPSEIRLDSVESFVSPGGWHFICHYIAHTTDEPQSSSYIKKYRWVTTGELSEIKDIAHGKWEIEVGKAYLDSK